eukprot:TRINITY_DN4737_c0_g1_i1.p1 TRINITY_DN4737_c0_g1~~TRINITY_DN4737_c0_g1_i1.p1  ORF type:complete len:570 (+),score=107.70 TRINITY_DN4737_c0_g1_i1:35-1744(+)
MVALRCLVLAIAPSLVWTSNSSEACNAIEKGDGEPSDAVVYLQKAQPPRGEPDLDDLDKLDGLTDAEFNELFGLTDALDSLGEAIDESIAKQYDAASKKALEEAKEKYDKQVMSWSKMKKELTDKPEVAVKAAKEAISGIKNVIGAIQDDKPVDAVAASLTAVGAVLSLIPGGQGFGLAFSMVGMIVGLFAPTSSSPRPLTASDAVAIVEKVVRQEFVEAASAGTYADLMTQCNNVDADMKLLWNQVRYWKDYNAATGQQRKTLSKEIDKLINDMDNIIKHTLRLYSSIDTAVDEGRIVGRSKQKCFDACAALTVPYHSYLANPSNPNNIVLNDKAWTPCAVGGREQPKMNNKAYKLCIWHGTYIQKAGYYDAYKKTMESCRLDKGCEERVDRIDGCRKEVEDSKVKFARLSKVLACAAEKNMNIQTILQSVHLLGAMHDYFPFYDKDFKAKVGGLESSAQMLLFWQLNRNISIAETFTYDGKDYRCDDKESWLEAIGYKSDVLQKAPCSTDDWVRIAPDYSGYKSDALRCSVVNPNMEEAPWEWEGPTYDYKRLTEMQWSESFLVPYE